MPTFRTQVDTSSTYIHNILSDFWKYDTCILEFVLSESDDDLYLYFNENGLTIHITPRSLVVDEDLFIDCKEIYIIMSVNNILVINAGFSNRNLEDTLRYVVSLERRCHELLKQFSDLRYSEIYINYIIRISGLSVMDAKYWIEEYRIIDTILRNLNKVQRGEYPDMDAYNGLTKRIPTKSAR
mgnify:CR=1 FL=1